MIKRIKSCFIVCLLCVFIFGIPVYAEQEQLITVSLDNREVKFGRTVKMTIEVDNSIANDFELPKIPDFLVVPKKNYTEGNKKIFTYELSPKQAGIFDLPAVDIAGIKSNVVSIRVSEPEKYNKTSYSNSNRDIFVEAYTDIGSVYVNQEIYYTLRFATKYDLASNPSYILPMFKDFWKGSSKVKSGYRLIEGENYFVFEVVSRLYPMRDGEITIDEASVSVVAEEPGGRKKRNLNTKPVTIKVFPLPVSGRPENFSGAVGKYSISASVSKKNVVVNEPVHLNIFIKGNGNVNSIIEPELNLSEDIQKYATTYKIKDKNASGSKEFKCVLIPLSSGVKYIPEISFSYFDPDYRDYSVIKTKRIDLNVKEGTYSADTDSAENEQENSEVKNEEIKDIFEFKDMSFCRYGNSYIKDKFLFKFIVLCLVVFFVYSAVFRIKIIYSQRDKLKIARQKALNESLKYLKLAGTAVNKLDKDKFYFNSDMALRKYIQSKNNCDYTVMLKEDIKNDLIKRKINVEVADSINKIFTDCEYFKFTQIKSTKEYMEQTVNEVKNIMKQLDEFYEKNNN